VVTVLPPLLLFSAAQPFLRAPGREPSAGLITPAAFNWRSFQRHGTAVPAESTEAVNWLLAQHASALLVAGGVVASRAMGSAVVDLQKAILAGNLSLTQLLRQTKVIAANLGLADVETWLDSELNGYPSGTEQPKYRKVQTASLEIHYVK
jgi:hypothetical protein